MGTRILNVVLLFLIGLVVGTIGTIAHQSTVSLFAVAFPWGVIVSLAAVAALLVGLRLINGGRLPALAAGAGVLVSILAFAIPSAGGSNLITDQTLWVGWIAGAIALAVVIVGWPNSRQPSLRPAAMEVPENRIS